MRDRVLSWWGMGAAGFALASIALFGMAIGFDPSAGAETTDRILAASTGDASFIRWGALADMLGYYLIPAGLIIAVRERVPWTSSVVRDISTVGFVAYAVMGSIGAAALAAAVPALIEAGLEARLTLETLLRVVEGIWQWLEPIPFTAWAFGMCLAFRGRSTLWFSAFAVLSSGGALVWLGRVFDIEPMLIVGLTLWLGPFPFVFAAIGSWVTAGAREEASG